MLAQRCFTKKRVVLGIACLVTLYMYIVLFHNDSKRAYGFVDDIWFEYTEQRSLSHKDDMVKQRLEEGARIARKNCDVVKPNYILRTDEQSVKRNFILDRDHNLAYCTVEKVGSTFWRRVFQILGRGLNDSNPFNIKEVDAFKGYETAENLAFDEIYKVLHGSTKFMFAREPFQRLFSGYVDKLYAPNSMYWSYIGRYVIEHFRKDASNFSRQCGHDVTFAEFVQYFIFSQGKNARRDPHFISVYDHCRPCEIQYDYVGKLETFKEDALSILQIHNLSSFVKFQDFRKESERDAILTAVDWLYFLKYDILKCMSLPQALFRIWRKLQIRGLFSKDATFPFSFDSSKELNEREVKEILLKAYEKSASSTERKQNREEAFLQAYNEISSELLNQLRDALFVDSKLFGYDAIPSKLLRMKSNPIKISDFRYFDFTH